MTPAHPAHRTIWKSMRRKDFWLVSIVLAIAAAVYATPASQPATKPVQLSAEGVEYFEKHIRPVLVERCYRCHSKDADKVKGGLLVDSRDGLLKGGDGGPVLIPGEPGKSRLIIAIQGHDEEIRMPPKEPLAEAQVARFVAWVKMGAPDPRTAEALAKPAPPAYDYEKAKEFWAFKAVKDHAPPAVRDAHWPINEVDRFVLAKLEEKGLKPVGSADRIALIRRATFDLTG